MQVTAAVQPGRWLALAGSLTGAANCVIAFAQSGHAAPLAWGAAAPDAAVVAFDADGRRLPLDAAAARRTALLAAGCGIGTEPGQVRPRGSIPSARSCG